MLQHRHWRDAEVRKERYLNSQYMERASQVNNLMPIRRLAHPRIVIQRLRILHVPHADIAMIEPGTDLVPLIAHVFPRRHAEDVVHFFHGDDVALCARDEEPDEE